jgi:hypothetical protein
MIGRTLGSLADRLRQRRLLAAALVVSTVSVTGGLKQAQDIPIQRDVEYLAHDDREGRVTGEPGWYEAHAYIHDRLLEAGISPVRISAQPTPGNGLNLFGRIDGGDPARSDQYILVGAHYDHVHMEPNVCDPKAHRNVPEPEDDICNGATDNAAGVAAVLEIARQLAAGPAPARSVVFAFWDREEIDLGGSAHFRSFPLPAPWPQQLVTYVNYDIQGANLLRQLRSTTFAVGASSGGPTLQSALINAAATEPGLTLRQLSEPLGLYTSDYANFLAPATINRSLGHPPASLPRIPTVYFTDSNGPCYHTTQDEIDIVDFPKLARQANMGVALVSELANRSSPPAIVPYDEAQNVAFYARIRVVAQDLALYVPSVAYYDPGPIPPPTREDAEQLLALARAASGDGALDATARATLNEQIRVLSMILNARTGLYSPLFWYPWAWRRAGPYRPVEDGVFVALAALQALEAIKSLPCDGFLD